MLTMWRLRWNSSQRQASGLARVLATFVFCQLAFSLSQIGRADQPKEDDTKEVSFARVTSDLKTLASDEMSGRLPGTPEIEKAAEYIIEQYKAAGLKPAVDGESFRQTFDVGRTQELVKDKSKLVLVGPQGKKIELKIDQQFIPQVANESYDLNADLVFVGYGIKAEELNYDEYRNLDVDGKIVVLIRQEPQQTDANSVFDGTDISKFAFLNAKVAAARAAGAAAIIMVNDNQTAPAADRDELSPSELFGRTVSRMPFAHIKRSTLDELLKVTPLVKGSGDKLSSLADIEKSIDGSLEPVSQAIAGWKAEFKSEFERKASLTSNIIGVLEGEGPFANETIVIGGHYDHLGLGAYGSRAPDRKEVHNGADDNATGTVCVIELARRFAKADKKPARRLVFICFSAEEMGLIGAQHYVANPLFPLENTVAMFNYDMIGSMSDKKLTAYSWNSAVEFGELLDKANEEIKIDLQKPPGGFGASDHAAFQSRQIPVIFFHTGLTPTYHTPDDDFETINLEGMFDTINLSERFIKSVLAMPERPKLAEGAGATRRPPRVSIGAMLSSVEGGEGAQVDEVADDSLAAKAGLKVGDVIVEVAGEKITTRRDVTRLLGANVNKKVKIKFKRGSETQEIEIELKVD